MLEAGDRFGGKIRTTPFAGRPVDEAADAFLARVPEAVDLCRRARAGRPAGHPGRAPAPTSTAAGELRPLPRGPGARRADRPRRAGRVRRGAQPDGRGAAPAEDLTMGPDARPGTGGGAATSRWARSCAAGWATRCSSGWSRRCCRRSTPATPTSSAWPPARPQLRGRRARATAASSAGCRPSAGRRRPRRARSSTGWPTGTETLIDALVDAARGWPGARPAPAAPGRADDPTGRRRAPSATPVALRGPRGRRGPPLDADAVILTTPARVTAAAAGAARTRTLAAAMAAVDYASVALVALAVPRRRHRPPARRQRLPRGPARGPAAHGVLVGVEQVGPPGRPDHRDPAGVGGPRRRHPGRRPDDDELVDAVLRRPGHHHGPARRRRRPRGSPAGPARCPSSRVGHLDRVRAWRAELAAEHPGLRGGRRRAERARHPGLHRPGPGRGPAVWAARSPARRDRAAPDVRLTPAVLLHGYEDAPGRRRGGPGRRSALARWSSPAARSSWPAGPAWFASDDDGPVDAQLRWPRSTSSSTVVTAAAGSGRAGRVGGFVPGRRRGAGAGACGTGHGPTPPAGVFCVNGWLPHARSLSLRPGRLAAAGTRVLVVASIRDEVVLVQQGRSAARYLERGGVDVDVRRAARRPHRRAPTPWPRWPAGWRRRLHSTLDRRPDAAHWRR